MTTDISIPWITFEQEFVPSLFDGVVEASTKAGYRDVLAERAFVERRLLEIIRDGKLCVTHLLRQPGHLPDVIGGVILGTGYVHDGPDLTPATFAVHPEISKARCTIQTINGHDGVRLRELLSPRAVIAKGRSAGVQAFGDQYGRVPLYEHRSRDRAITCNEASIDLPTAWRVLRRSGRQCRPCKRTAARRTMWIHQELHPRLPWCVEPRAKNSKLSEAAHG